MADEEEVPPPYIDKTAFAKENVSALLHAWGLPELKSRFRIHCVEARALHCLTEKDICELIPKIGRRAIFRSSLFEWRRQHKRHGISVRLSKRSESKAEENIPIPQLVIKDERTDFDESDGNSELRDNNDGSLGGMEPPEESTNGKALPGSEERTFSVVIPNNKTKECQIDVNEILTNSYEGQQIIAYYEVNGSFDYNHRRRLVTLLINEVIRKNRWLVQDDFAKISHDIVQLFPREDETTYYMARNGSKNPKGCLYNKFLNLTRKLRQEGILQYRNNVHLLPERISARHSGEIKCYRESS